MPSLFLCHISCWLLSVAAPKGCVCGLMGYLMSYTEHAVNKLEESALRGCAFLSQGIRKQNRCVMFIGALPYFLSYLLPLSFSTEYTNGRRWHVKAERVEMLCCTNDVSSLPSLLGEAAYVPFTRYASLIPAEQAEKQVTQTFGLLDYLIGIEPSSQFLGFFLLGA